MATLKVFEPNGNLKKHVPGWSFGTFKNHTQVGNGKPRKISGWYLRSHDGVERFCEGNWQQFVPFAQRIADNYGFTTNLS